VPGSGASYDLIADMQDRGIDFYGITHEASAAIMAGAFGRMSASIGCSVSVRGAGLANMVPGIASNHLERWPAISISEGLRPGQWHKRIDHRAVLSTMVTAFGTAGHDAQVIDRLLQRARRDVPGPVHLDLVRDARTRFASRRSSRTRLDREGEWSDALSVIRRSRRPLVIAGASVQRRAWLDQLSRLRCPVFTTVAGKGLLDERLPHAAGVFTGAGQRLSPEHRLLGAADVVVTLGVRSYELLSPVGPVPVVRVDARFTAGCIAVRQIAAFNNSSVEQEDELLDCVAGHDWGAGVVANAHAELRKALLRHPWLPPTLVIALAGTVPSAVMVADTGSFCTIAEHLWQAVDPTGFLCSANGRFMGTAIPMAIAAALAQPGRPVICLTGDGGVRMYFGEIKLAVERNLPILFLYLSDGSYGSIASTLVPIRRRSSILGIAHPSWHAAALAIGCSACRVTDMDGFATAVAAWHESDGPFFLEAAFDTDAYAAMTYDIR
jgi:acetolactate synthase-1/2/3 large subunit